MIVYICLLIILLSLNFFILYGLKKKRMTPKNMLIQKESYKYKVSFIISIIILGGFSAIRDGIGLDYSPYMHHIFNIQHGVDTYMESGFEIFCRIIYMVSTNPRTVLVCLAILTMVFNLYSIYKLSDNLIMSLFLFLTWGYYFLTFMTVRNYFALSIALVSLVFLKERKKIIFIILICLATAFHKSALVCLILYLLACKKINKKILLMSSLVVIVLAWIFKDQVRMIVFYIYPIYENSVYDNNSVSILNIVKALIVVGVGYLYYSQIVKTRRDTILFNLNVFALITYVGFYWLPEVSRIVFYMNITSIIILPNIIEIIKDNKTRHIYKIGVYIGSVILFLLLLQGFYSETIQLLPYKSWLFNGGY